MQSLLWVYKHSSNRQSRCTIQARLIFLTRFESFTPGERQEMGYKRTRITRLFYTNPSNIAQRSEASFLTMRFSYEGCTILLAHLVSYLTHAIATEVPASQNSTLAASNSFQCSSTLPFSPFYITYTSCARTYICPRKAPLAPTLHPQ